MFNEMQEMLERAAAAMLTGRTDELAQRCHYPMVVHSADRVLPFQTPQDYAATLAHVGTLMRDSHKVTAITSRLRSIEVPRSGRFRAFARMTCHFGNGCAPQTTDVTYFCRLTGSEIKVEMVEMDCALLPDQPIRGRVA